MSKRCIYCGKPIIEGDICPHCQKSNDLSSMTVKGVHELHQNAHNNITKYSEKKNSGLVFIVLGTLLLIIGSLFLFLSFKYNSIRVREFRPASVEFVVCIICLTLSVTGLTLGFYKLIDSLINLKFYRSVITDTKISR